MTTINAVPPRRMQGFCGMHGSNGRCNGQGQSQTEMAAKDLKNRHPDYGRYDMSPHEISWLGQGALDGPVNQNCRSAEGPNNKYQVSICKKVIIQKRHGHDPAKSPQPGPENFRKSNSRRTLSPTFHLIEKRHKITFLMVLYF